TCFQLIERLARLQEMLITDNPEGDLILTIAGQEHGSTVLLQGDNLQSASADLDNSQRFSHYIAKAQRAGNKTNDNKMVKYPYTGLDPPPNVSVFDGWFLSRRASAALARARRPRDDTEEDPPEDNPDDPATDVTTDRGPTVITEIMGEADDPEITRYRVHV